MREKYIFLALILGLTGCATDQVKAGESVSVVEKKKSVVNIEKEIAPVSNLAPIVESKSIEEKIGSMLMVGFLGT